METRCARWGCASCRESSILGERGAGAHGEVHHMGSSGLRRGCGRGEEMDALSMG